MSWLVRVCVTQSLWDNVAWKSLCRSQQSFKKTLSVMFAQKIHDNENMWKNFCSACLPCEIYWVISGWDGYTIQHKQELWQEFTFIHTTLNRPSVVMLSQYIQLIFPEQNGCVVADDNFKCIFLNKSSVFWLKFHWNLFLRVQWTITQRWFR